MECKYCQKIIKNKGSLVAHELCCSKNPKKIKHKRGIGAGHQKGCAPWNKGLTKETDKRLEKIGQTFHTNYLNGKYQKPLGVAHTKKLEQLRRKKLSMISKSLNYGGYCARSGRGKQGWYKNIWCQSSWELAWVIWAFDKKIQFEKNWKSFEYFYNGRRRKYFPDFLLSPKKYLEIKGYSTKQVKAKIKQFPYHLEILGKKEMEPILKYVTEKYGKDFIKLYDTNCRQDARVDY